MTVKPTTHDVTAVGHDDSNQAIGPFDYADPGRRGSVAGVDDRDKPLDRRSEHEALVCLVECHIGSDQVILIETGDTNEPVKSLP